MPIPKSENASSSSGKLDSVQCVLAGLLGFTQELNGSGDARSVSALMHRRLETLMALTAFQVFIPLGRNGSLNRVYGVSEGQLLTPQILPGAGCGPLARCIAERRDQLCQDTQKDSEHDDLEIATERSGSLSLYVPMVSGDQLVGVVLIGAPSVSSEARTLVHMLCAMATMVLAHIKELRFCRLLRQVIDESDEAIAFYDEFDGILFTNQAYHRVFPHYPPPERLVGMKHEDLYRHDLAVGVIDDPLAKSDPEAYLAERIRLMNQLQGAMHEIQSINNRTYVYTRSRSSTGVTLSRRTDITEIESIERALRVSERQLRKLAFQDALTGLSNRTYFLRRLQAVIQSSHLHANQSFCLLLLDLDGFKAVNDQFGHPAGDALLKIVADRLRSSVREADTIARLGGDEFAVLLEPGIQSNVASSVAIRMRDIFHESFVLGENHVTINGSIGIATWPDDGFSEKDLLSAADLAMNQSKREESGAFQFFKPTLKEQAKKRLELIQDLQDALPRRQLKLVYQPLFNLGENRISGFEALLRWYHPRWGYISPTEFIPLAEEAGLIASIGQWVLHQACLEAVQWPANVSVAVNVSSIQIKQGQIAEVAMKALSVSGLAPSRLELEITESTLLDHGASTLATLGQCRRAGVRIALDDFGTGYSSLSYLNAFPIDKIKIDRSFIKDLAPANYQGSVILRAIIGLGISLGVTTTAEGVETLEQLALVRAEGCTEIQGYLLSPPKPAHEVTRLLSANLDLERVVGLLFHQQEFTLTD
ncbi:MAG: EAL domain-containing protein [Gammaproteobacteria bacterium]|nr:EAL domain-containing protein [Gammaproteobacteria bacterium]